MRHSLPSLRNRRPGAYRWPEPGGSPLMAAANDNEARAADKRRQILDAAIRVFARQGFHSARVSRHRRGGRASPTGSSTTTSTPRSRC